MSKPTDIEDSLYRLLANHDLPGVVLGLSLIIVRLGFVREGMEIARLGDAVILRARGNLPRVHIPPLPCQGARP
jgi:hypothetical protein